MYFIYCAFNYSLNEEAWRRSNQAHMIKIGATKNIKEREDGLNKGVVVTTVRRTAPLTNREGWKIELHWPVHYEWDDVKRLEREIRRSFKRICGRFKLYKEMRLKMREIDNDLNGLSENVCADLGKVGQSSFPPIDPNWKFSETPRLIGEIVVFVQSNDLEWRRMAGMPGRHAH